MNNTISNTEFFTVYGIVWGGILLLMLGIAYRTVQTDRKQEIEYRFRRLQEDMNWKMELLRAEMDRRIKSLERRA